jgi:hypothetical protein
MLFCLQWFVWQYFYETAEKGLSSGIVTYFKQLVVSFIVLKYNKLYSSLCCYPPFFR